MLCAAASLSYTPGVSLSGRPATRPAASAVRMDSEGEMPVFGLARGQKYGPTSPAHPATLPWTNKVEQEHVQIIKATSSELREPLLADMANDEIFVSKDSSKPADCAFRAGPSPLLWPDATPAHAPVLRVRASPHSQASRQLHAAEPRAQEEGRA